MKYLHKQAINVAIVIALSNKDMCSQTYIDDRRIFTNYRADLMAIEKSVSMGLTQWCDHPEDDSECYLRLAEGVTYERLIKLLYPEDAKVNKELYTELNHYKANM
jgi:hypothetical protein